MAKQKTNSGRRPRLAALRDNGTYNHSVGEVTDSLFVGDGEFFNPHDLVQVKYEMLRSVRAENLAVTHAAAAFGFSRVSYYQTLHAFQQHGMNGLLSRPHGPRRAHKLNDEVMAFVDACRQEEPDKEAEGLVSMIQREFGLRVHVRSLQRALTRRKKTSEFGSGRASRSAGELRASAGAGLERARGRRLGKATSAEPGHGGVAGRPTGSGIKRSAPAGCDAAYIRAA